MLAGAAAVTSAAAAVMAELTAVAWVTAAVTAG